MHALILGLLVVRHAIMIDVKSKIIRITHKYNYKYIIIEINKKLVESSHAIKYLTYRIVYSW